MRAALRQAKAAAGAATAGRGGRAGGSGGVAGPGGAAADVVEVDESRVMEATVGPPCVLALTLQWQLSVTSQQVALMRQVAAQRHPNPRAERWCVGGGGAARARNRGAGTPARGVCRCLPRGGVPWGPARVPSPLLRRVPRGRRWHMVRQLVRHLGARRRRVWAQWGDTLGRVRALLLQRQRQAEVLAWKHLGEAVVVRVRRRIWNPRASGTCMWTCAYAVGAARRSSQSYWTASV